MKHGSLFAIAVVLCLMLLALPVPMAAQPADPSSGPRAIDSTSLTAIKTGPAAPITVAGPLTARILEPTQPGVWHTGPFPPGNFQYARHDAAFVAGPAGEAWANKVYFLGGRTSPPTESPNIWMFDPLTLTYTDTGADVIEDVSNYNANLILDDGTGRGPAIYVIGGTDKDHGGVNIGTVQRYYPQINLAEALPAADNWNGMVAGYRVACVGSAVVDDVIYVYGGWQSNVAPYFSTETWRFDPNLPSGSRWENLTTAPLHTARSYIQSAVQGGKIYAIGGVGSYVGGELDPTAAVEVLDTANLAAGWTVLAPMPTAGGEGRGYGFESDTLSVHAPWQGKLYVVASNDWAAVSSEVLEYDIATNTWSDTFPELPTPRADLAGTYVPLCSPDPNDGLPGMWTFGGRVNESCDPPLGPTEYYPMSCYSQCSILLVDDDWDFDQTVSNDGGRPYYTSALDYLGLSYGVWDTVSQGTPSAAEMAGYDVVVWFTGYDWVTPISPTEQIELSTYLDNGGNLFVSSQEQEYAFPGSPIMSGYLGVFSVVEDVTLLGVAGGAADPIFAGLGPYEMARPDEWAAYWPTGDNEGPYDDEVYAQIGSFEPMVYTDNSQPNATRYISDTFKTVYLGFPFEWLPDQENRAELMGKVLQDWFGCELPCIGLDSVSIGGPAEMPLGESGTFTATLSPEHASPPVDIVWSNGLTGTVAVYAWAEPGWQTVAVTATNCYGGVVLTATVDVLVTCDALEAVTISGPVELLAGQTGGYLATLDPPTATLPINLSWDNGTIGASATYSWTIPGDYTVVVTATNCAGLAEVTGTLGVMVAPQKHYVYLPIVVKNE